MRRGTHLDILLIDALMKKGLKRQKPPKTDVPARSTLLIDALMKKGLKRSRASVHLPIISCGSGF